jgi:hypothetical protein
VGASGLDGPSIQFVDDACARWPLECKEPGFGGRYAPEQGTGSHCPVDPPGSCPNSNGYSAGCFGATMQFIVNDGNSLNEERGSRGLSGEGDSNALPFPRPQPLLEDAKTLK